MASLKRRERLRSLLTEELGRFLAREPTEPGTLMTITEVIISPGLGEATVRISVYPHASAAAVVAACKERVWRIQQALNKRLKMRPVPKIRFVLDRSESKASRVADLLKKVAGE